MFKNSYSSYIVFLLHTGKGRRFDPSICFIFHFTQIYTIYTFSTTFPVGKQKNNFVLNIFFSISKIGDKSGNEEWIAENNWSRHKTDTETLGFEQHTISFMFAAPFSLRRYLLCAYNVYLAHSRIKWDSGGSYMYV